MGKKNNYINKNKNQTNTNYINEEEEKEHGKKIIILIIIVAILLSLITSCSCTSNFFGKLGASLSDSIHNLFNNEEDFTIDDDTDDEETVTDSELKFDTNGLEVTLGDPDIKISFSYKKLKPGKFTCSTSDANIATCHVVNGYVVVSPKAQGNVKIYLQTEANGKIYEATTNVTIKDPIRSIDLSSNGGTIDLKNTNKVYVSYRLVNLTGNVTVTSSNGAVATAVANNGTLVITAHKKGSATITVSITYNGITYRNSYKLTVKEEEKEEEIKPDDTVTSAQYLKDLVVLNKQYSLDKKFNKTQNTYSMKVAYNENNLSLSATLEDSSSSISYKLNGNSISNLNNLNLIAGKNNKLEIIVKSKNGKTNTYVVNIYKSIRTIQFEYDSYIVYTGNTYDIHYFVEEDGQKLSDDKYNMNDISASLSKYQDECVFDVKKGTITFSPSASMSGSNIDLTITYNGKTAKTVLKAIDYYLSTYVQKYDVGFMNNYGEKSIILNTNMFIAKKVNITTSSDKKEIHMCAEDGNTCVDLTVDKNKDNANIEIEYIGESEDPYSLPFRVVVHSTGSSFIHVSGSAFGENKADFDIAINAVPKYVVTLKANGGTFNELTTEYEFLLSDSDELDLALYDEPYKENKEECSLYKFKGYSESKDGSIVYNRTDKAIIRNLNRNLTLYAIYETDSIPMKEENLKKTLWLKDPNLFYNEEYFKEHKQDKVIYPGAKGTYKMNFKNESSDKIIITGMTLKENTICIANKGCLNMGYIIKYSASESNDWTYYYGASNDQYTILHSANGSVKLGDESFKTDIMFKEGEKIEVDPSEEIVISLFWKWDDSNDEVDTLIGNQAAETLRDQSINDKYGLSIGLHFETERKSCNG